MSLGSSIAQAFAAIFSYLAIRGVDQIFGKWIAYVMVAFEKTATEKGLKAFRDAMQDVVVSDPAKWQNWDDWRKTHLPKDS